MWFGTLIIKNIVRRPLRSVLTILAIALAIGSVVSLVGISSGFERTFLSIYNRKGVDIIVVRSGATQRLSSALPQHLGDKIRTLDGVKEIIPGLIDVISMDNGRIPSVVLQGWIPETAVFDHLTVLRGRLLNRYDTRSVMLGTVLARNLGKDVGDKIQLVEDGDFFDVVGVHETHNVFENGALVISLPELQKLMDRKNQVTGYSVILDPEMKKSDPELVSKIRHQIESMEKNISAMGSQDHVQSLTEIRIVKAMAWLTSAIALAIGLFGVMNTMVMAVSERTKEIGILRAVGWRPGRVLKLVLLEAVLLSLIGAILGVVGSVALVQSLTRLPQVSGLIDPNISPIFFLYGFVIAAVVGLVGGILPARRASRMLPTAALRQE
ncbi:MAG: FtsX-like permease family protein [Gemmataceae bacterium]